VFWPALAVMGGMVVSFLSLMLVRGMERSNQTLRRVVYGFTAVLTSLLLLAVLAVPNVLAYAPPFSRFFGKTYDWTQLKVYTLSDATKNLLTDLREPVKFYLLRVGRDPVAEDVLVLLDNFRSVNPKVTYDVLDMTSRASLMRLNELLRTHNVTADIGRGGVLVVTEAEGKKPGEVVRQHDFVKRDDLISQAGMGRSDTSYTFNGENALLNAIRFVTETKATIYFTQGSGELSLQGAMPMRGRAPAGGGSLQRVRDRLTQQKNVEVKELKLDAGVRKVPDDATVVVVARPTRAIPPQGVEVLRDWMRAKKGKLVILVDPVLRGDGDVKGLVSTGLEGLLAEYSVRLGNNRVMNGMYEDPLLVEAFTNPESQNPVAAAFGSRGMQVPFTFTPVRTVEAIEAGPKGGAARAEPLVMTLEVGYWVESDLNAQPAALQSELRRSRDVQAKKLAREPITIAVAVSDSSDGGMPRDMAHRGLFKEKPRMVVFGNGSWIGDEALRLRPNQLNLFTSCLTWLRERPDVGKPPENRERKVYQIGVSQESMTRLRVLPLGLMLLGVIGLGTGVWVVRRR
jgi:hypothetical protein